MNKILLVEDSEAFQKVVVRTLAHHQLTVSTHVDDALELLRKESFDLILLDINLPEKNGYSLLSELQASSWNKSIPVICLTGKTEITDKVTAFSLGAEDYIVKPFDPLELRARVDAKLQKNKRSLEESKSWTVGSLEIDQSTHRVIVRNGGEKEEITLTQTEFKLLCCFAKSLDRVFSRDQLLVAAWGDDATVSDRVVDVHICALRKKLGGYAKCVQAVPGVGYRFVSPEPKKKQAA